MPLIGTMQVRNNKRKVHDFLVLDDQEKALLDKKIRKEKVKSMILCLILVLISIVVVNLI